MTHSANRGDSTDKKPDGAESGAPPEAPFAGSDEPTLPPDSESSEAPTVPPEQGASLAGGTIELGAHLPDLELLGEIGRGGMGVVYKARQKSLDRLVAVKMLLHQFCQNEVALKRFYTEARTAANLKHPNIVGIHQVGESAIGPFFIMEYIEGQTLEQTLKKREPGKPVSIAGAVDLIIPVAEAVAYGHRAGIVHRDLKPANIMIDEFKRPIVMDFGIAKVAGAGANLTGQGVVMGTPAYMPPEQVDQSVGTVGSHSDVYALGAILYRLLTNKFVFEGDTPLLTLLMVLSPDLPVSVRQLRMEVSRDLNRICMKCLNKAPADRFADAGALARELRSIRSQPQLSLSGSHVALLRAALVSTQTGKAFTLKGGVNVVGRTADCEVVLKSPAVSKRHCQILIRGDQVTVEDLGSVNGTLVNGEPMRRGVLKDGDVLGVGEHRLTLRLNPGFRQA
jgi:serine/threonine-protein kinase